MSAGSFTFHPGPVPLARPAQRFVVARYEPLTSDEIEAESDRAIYQIVPNVVCLSIRPPGQGPDYGAARFRYVTGDPLHPEWPQRLEDLYPLAAAGPFVVHQDARLVVLRGMPKGQWEPVFDGFSQIPQADLDGDRELITFEALGTPFREWDTPLAGALMRNGEDPTQTDGNIPTDLPARFNPDGRPNCTPEGADKDQGDDPDVLGPTAHPVFIDVKIAELVLDPDEPEANGRYWTLGRGARYVIFEGNPDQTYIRNPDADGIDTLLESITVADGYEFIDPEDPDSFDSERILVPDLDVTADPWPIALQKIIEPHGFGMRFQMEVESGEPVWDLVLYRTDDKLPIKDVYLQQAGSTLEPGESNVGSMSLQRDAARIVNEWIVDTRETRFEASFELAPGFLIDPDDATTDNKDKWGRAGELGAANPFKYRKYVLDEAGLGHWDLITSEWRVGEPTELAAVLSNEAGAGDYPYPVRCRPGRQKLFTRGADGEELKFQVWIKRVKDGPTDPRVWDGLPDGWLQVQGGYQLLDEECGILIDVDDPNDWRICTGEDVKSAREAGAIIVGDFDGGTVKGVEDQATAGGAKFKLRLTVVIPGDRGLSESAKSGRRKSSTTSFTVQRRDDARDRFVRNVISYKSHLNTTGLDIDARDDTDDAKAHTGARQRAHEMATFTGKVVCPRFTDAYRVGDKIRGIRGREVSFRSSLGGGQKEGPRYPTLVGLEWMLEPRQETVLTFVDKGAAEPAAARRESAFD